MYSAWLISSASSARSRGAVGQLAGLAQVVGGAVVEGGDPGLAQLPQHEPSQFRRRRFGDGTAEQGHRVLRASRTRGAPEVLHRGRIPAAAARGQEMDGDAATGFAPSAEERRGARVRVDQLGACDAGRHRRAQDRVAEAHGGAVGQDLRRHQRGGGVRAGGLVEAGQRGRHRQLGLGAEDGDGPRERLRVRREPGEAAADRRGDAVRGECGDRRNLLGRGRDAGGHKLTDELGDEKRNASGLLVTRAGKRRVGHLAELPSHDRRDRGDRQRRRRQPQRRRMAEEGVDDLGADLRVRARDVRGCPIRPGTDGRDDGDGRAVEAAHEVRQPP